MKMSEWWNLHLCLLWLHCSLYFKGLYICWLKSGDDMCGSIYVRIILQKKSVLIVMQGSNGKSFYEEDCFMLYTCKFIPLWHGYWFSEEPTNIELILVWNTHLFMPAIHQFLKIPMGALRVTRCHWPLVVLFFSDSLKDTMRLWALSC